MHAQAPAPAPAPKLFINILDGEGALNNIRLRTAHEPIVEVQDENHKPVAGAAVLFALPGSGPSGFFANGLRAFSTLTDAEGHAVATGLQPNSIAGSYDIHVTASYQKATAETTIHQKNVGGETPNTTTTTTGAAVHGGALGKNASDHSGLGCSGWNGGRNCGDTRQQFYNDYTGNTNNWATRGCCEPPDPVQ